MGIEPTQDLLGPALVLKTRSATRRQSPPYGNPLFSTYGNRLADERQTISAGRASPRLFEGFSKKKMIREPPWYPILLYILYTDGRSNRFGYGRLPSRTSVRKGKGGLRDKCPGQRFEFLGCRCYHISRLCLIRGEGHGMKGYSNEHGARHTPYRGPCDLDFRLRPRVTPIGISALRRPDHDFRIGPPCPE